MRSRTIALAGLIGTLAIAAAPVAAIAAPAQHSSAKPVRVDRSLDTGSVRHIDRTRDRASSPDRSSGHSSVDVRGG